MAGGGAALQVQGRDEALNAQVMAREDARAKSDMDRQTALEDIRQRNQVASLKLGDQMSRDRALDEATGTLGTAKREAGLLAEQAKFDQANNPANVATAAATAAAMDKVKPYELSPGQQRFVDGKIVNENTRLTGAEVTADLYREGYKSGGGSNKLNPEYVDTVKQLDEQAKHLSDKIVDLKIKTGTDPMVDKKGSEGVLRDLQQQQAAIQGQRRRAQIEYGYVDPDRTAATLAPSIQSLDDLNAHLQSATRDGGPAWSNRVADAFQRAGVPQRFKSDGNTQQSKDIDRGLTDDIKTGAPVDVTKVENGIISRAMNEGRTQESLFDKETREIERGLRTDYSEAAKAEQKALSDKLSATRSANESAFMQRERERLLRQSREIRGR